jgi:hypothetical protein
MSGAAPRHSAQVVLRPASGKAPALPPSTANLAEYLPSPQAAERVAAWFRGQGFEVGPVVGTSFSVTGPPSLFERVFGARKGLEYALDRLPDDVAPAVEAVALSPPPDFGPGNP